MLRRYPVPVSVPVSVVVRRLPYDAGRCTILGIRHSRKLGGPVASIHSIAEKGVFSETHIPDSGFLYVNLATVAGFLQIRVLRLHTVLHD